MTAAAQTPAASTPPTMAEIRSSNVLLEFTWWDFGSGLLERDNNGIPRCNGLDQGVRRGAGSAIIVDVSGKLLTNFHVARRALEMTAKFDSGATYPVRVIKGYDAVEDLAVLQIAANTQFTRARLGNSDGVAPQDPVTAVGNAGATGLNVTQGQVSMVAKDDITHEPTYIQHTAPILEGSSGGALYKGNRVVGVNVSKIRNSNFAQAIPINRAQPLLRATASVPLPDAFPVNWQAIERKSELLFSETFTIPARTADGPGGWGRVFPADHLADYLILAQGPENVPVDILVLRAAGDSPSLVGCSKTRSPAPEAVALGVDQPADYLVIVRNSTEQPINGALDIRKIVW